MKIMLGAKISQGLFLPRDTRLSFRETHSAAVFTRSFTVAKVKKNNRHPMKPKIIITIRKPRASLPLHRESTSFKAAELTTVEPRKAKNLRVVDRAVRCPVH